MRAFSVLSSRPTARDALLEVVVVFRDDVGGDVEIEVVVRKRARRGREVDLRSS